LVGIFGTLFQQRSRHSWNLACSTPATSVPVGAMFLVMLEECPF
jgi:hypothetical protein